MKKKNLIILLMIPFIISLLGIITINASFNTFYSDITGIDWEYDDVTAFSSNVNRYLLNATGKNSNNAPLDKGNQLVWRVENKDKSILDPLARIEVKDAKSYLVPLGDGEVIITCSNLKGNVNRRMTGIIYSDGAITITPLIKGSGSNIDSTIYYGEYDLKNSSKVPSSFKLKFKTIPEDLNQALEIDYSDNLNIKRENNELTVEIKNSNLNKESFIKLKSGNIESLYEFEVVDEGVNCYSYNDLLDCTNKSKDGEIIVLRKSFESLATYNSSDKNNVTLFGNYDSRSKSFSFKDEIYRYNTTYNDTYIDEWNNFAESNKSYKEISKEVKAGLRVQKDIYGNGYTINMHNLTYPSNVIEVSKDGKIVEIPTLANSDLFRGPLPLYTLGDPNSLPLITAYAEDNSALYIDGDNIVINDVNLKSCDISSSLSFLNTVGNVINNLGDNNTIKNSRISNGKNVIRSFSSNNLLIDNSLLSNALNFLFVTGSNEYLEYDEKKEFELLDETGKTINNTLEEYFKTNGSGDKILNSYLEGSYKDMDLMRRQIDAIQKALNFASNIDFAGSTIINDTYFYHSGLSSIAFETLFNGPFLYNKNPSLIEELFSSASMGNKPIAPFIPTRVGGLSKPVSVDVRGKTSFYDYKNPNEIDLVGLIDENISKIASEITGSEKNITIDEVFPLKRLLIEEGNKKGSIINNNMNIAVAFYGGASNLSQISFNNLDNDFKRSTLEIDFLNEYLKLQSDSDNLMSIMKDVMVKCVTVVTGFEPFRFISVASPYLENETPNINDLINNAKGV